MSSDGSHGTRSEKPQVVDGMAIPELDGAAHTVGVRIAESPLVFDGDFENGSLDRVVRLGVDWYHIVLRQDTWYRFYFHIQGCAGREIVFEFTCREIRSPGYEEGNNRWISGGSLFKPLVSYDRKQWQAVDGMEKHHQDPGTYRFKHTFSGNEAYLCHHHPYTYTDMLEWLKTLTALPRVRIDSLGETRNGFAEPVLTLSDNPSGKDLVVIIGRENADEITGSWAFEGMLRALLSPSLRELLKRYTFKLVPMVGIDGVVAGAHHSAGYGYGGSRWHEEPSPTEIQNVKRAIRGWVAQGYRLRLAGKVHGFESFKLGDIDFLDGILTASPALKRAMESGVLQYGQGRWRGRTDKDSRIRPKGFFERFIVDEFGLYEVFSTHITGGSPEAARAGGEALMQGMANWLRVPGDSA